MQGNYNTKRTDLTGRSFGRLKVLGYEDTSSNGIAMWRVRCSCGTTFVAYSHNLRNGNTKSCGCIRRETVMRRLNQIREKKMEQRTKVINYMHEHGSITYRDMMEKLLINSPRDVMKEVKALMPVDTERVTVYDYRPDGTRYAKSFFHRFRFAE